MIFYGKQYRGKAFVEHQPISLIGPISPIGPMSLISLIGPIAPFAHTPKRIIAQMMPKNAIKY